MTQFSTRRLLLALAIVAMGLAILVAPLEEHESGCEMLGCSLVGAGVGLPFGRPWFGATLGVLFYIVCTIAAVSLDQYSTDTLAETLLRWTVGDW